MKTLAFAPPLLVLAIAFAGCNAASPNNAPPPQWLVGKYHYSASGTLVRKFPWDAKMDLVLERDGQYTMSVDVHIDDDNGGDTDVDESYGSYYVDGDKVVLQSAKSDDDDSGELQIRGRKLILKMPWTARMAFKGLHIPAPEFVKTE